MRDKNIHESEFMMTMANIWFSLSFGAASASFEVSEIDDQTHNDFFDEKFDEVRGEKEFDAESLDGISKALVGPFLNHENYSTFYSKTVWKKILLRPTRSCSLLSLFFIVNNTTNLQQLYDTFYEQPHTIRKSVALIKLFPQKYHKGDPENL